MSNNILSAEEFIEKDLIEADNWNAVLLKKDAIRLMIEFASAHVNAFKEKVADEAVIERWSTGYMPPVGIFGSGAHFTGCSSNSEYTSKGEKDNFTYTYKVNTSHIKSIIYEIN